MLVHRVAVGAVAVTLLALGACNKEGPTSPSTSSALAPALSQPTYDFHPGGDSIVAMFNVSIDAATMEATASPVAGRAAAMTQAKSYDLDLANFQNQASFKISGLKLDPDGDFRLFFTHAHPFAAPNLANPITAANRADLGYTARLLVLADSNTQAFFGGEATLDPTVLKNADGYLNPGDLLQQTGFSANSFPYKLLADEAQDNRIGESNGGSGTGSYNAGTGGWQRGNIGASNTGWTGYDYIHGGQSIENDLTIYASALAGATRLNFNVAILLKYTDPRGVGGKDFRFPPSTTDVELFAYRLPFAALDASQVAVGGANVNPLQSLDGDISFAVRDWDAAAVESSDPDPEDLSNEPDVSKVQPGATGAPQATLDVSSMGGLNNVSVVQVDGGESGTSDDPLQYAGTFSIDGGTADGSYYAALKIVDPENALDDSTYHFGVDPNNVTMVDPARALQLVTYQVLPVTVKSEAPPVITEVNPTGELGTPGALVTFTAVANPPATDWSWDFDGGAFPNLSTNAAPEQILLSPGNYTGTVTASNASGSSDPFDFDFTVIEGTGANPVAIITRPATTPPVGSGFWGAGNPYPATTDTKPIYLNRTQAADFSGEDSFDPDGTIEHWDWDFENIVTDPSDFNIGFASDIDLEDVPPHSYVTYGSTFAALRVTDDEGLQGFKRREVVVTPFEPQRIASPNGFNDWFENGSGARRTQVSRNGGYIIAGGGAGTGAANNPGYFTFTSTDSGATWSTGGSSLDSAIPTDQTNLVFDVDAAGGANPQGVYLSNSNVYFRRATSNTGSAMWAPTTSAARALVANRNAKDLALATSPVTPTGAIVAVAYQNFERDTLELYRSVNTGLGGGSTWTLIASLDAADVFPIDGVQIQIDGANHVHCIWREGPGVSYAQVDTADGTVLSQQALTTATGIVGSSHPALALDRTGAPIVVYSANLGGTNPDITLRRGDDSDDTVFGDEVILNTDNSGNPSGSLKQVHPTIALDASGRIWVAWEDERRSWLFDSGRGEIFCTVLNSDLTVLVGETVANHFDPFGLSRDAGPALAMDQVNPNVTPTLLWTFEGGGSGKRIMSARPTIF